MIRNKLIALLLAVTMCAGLFGCGVPTADKSAASASAEKLNTSVAEEPKAPVIVAEKPSANTQNESDKKNEIKEEKADEKDSENSSETSSEEEEKDDEVKYSESKVSYTNEAVYLRAGASTDDAALTTLAEGTKINLVGENGDWYKVTYANLNGYVKKDFVSSEKKEAASEEEKDDTTWYSSSKTMYATTELNLREGASSAKKALTTVKAGTAVSVTGENGDWYAVTANGTKGFMSKSYLSATKPEVDNTNWYSSSKTMYSTTELNLREGASSTTKALTTVKAGTAVSVTGENGDWYAVTVNGTKGFMSKSYLTATKPEETKPASPDDGTTWYSSSKTMYTNNSVNLRKGPGSNYGIIMASSFADEVTVKGENGGWYAVELKGHSGYMVKDYIVSEKPEPPKQEVSSNTNTGSNSNSSGYSDAYLLACLVSCEVGSCSYEAQLAVANVVMNRVADSRYPGNVYDVIYQPYQWGPASSGSLARRLASGPLSSAQQAANEALAGNNNAPGAIGLCYSSGVPGYATYVYDFGVIAVWG